MSQDVTTYWLLRICLEPTYTNNTLAYVRDDMLKTLINPMGTSRGRGSGPPKNLDGTPYFYTAF